ncbi:lytic transglycosylase domain-containing protein [Albimonas sp. CAU 1670]|uniref:lytic transglycosylase domain-containing protein n=1 Tax=Albimonas sp. CAU 1670 TaxID=3032599 RepID=UPI0023D9A9EE|nr:lytic transglycosylase domain-containing protein [Albimonas sp. CAU 1670]MDF2233507.1 lytic transglycosylase domain-containing protein [Albimonas sp. CAU 1670]
MAGLCEAAAERAARAEGVPLELMRAISLAETGRPLDGRLAPWPWTVNMEGEGRWFSTPEELLTWVRRRQSQGARSFDLGCFQVNHLWHGAAFEGLEDMLDPESNARYAARFLRALREETGSWEVAAGHYHSRTPDLAQRYRARVLAMAADLPDPFAPEAGPIPGLDAPGGRPAWWFASLSPLERTPGLAEAPPAAATTLPGENPAEDARADARAASLAHAWLSAGRAPTPPDAQRPLLAAPAGGGLLRRASPLIEAR